jgi:hypothetical protein
LATASDFTAPNVFSSTGPNLIAASYTLQQTNFRNIRD